MQDSKVYCYLAFTKAKVLIALKGSDGVVATFESHEQEIMGSNPTVTTDPERGALRIPLGLCNPFWSTQPNDRETVIEG